MFPTAIAGSLPKPAWLAETGKLWPKWQAEGDALARAKADATLSLLKPTLTYDGWKDVDLVIEAAVEVPELKQKIFGNMSKRAGELLRDDLEAKGPVRVSDVENAQREILAVARRMADAGEITLGASAEAMI